MADPVARARRALPPEPEAADPLPAERESPLRGDQSPPPVWSTDLAIVGAAWLASRGLIVIMWLLTMVLKDHSFTDVVGNWDVQHFATIARQGYAPDPQEMAFFPGLPILLRGGLVVGIPPEVFGVILAMVGSALAAWALMRIGGPWAAVLWLFAPTAVFTTVGYTEALFCAAAFWAWQRATTDRWGQAAALAAAAATLRVSGLFLIGALGLLALSWPAVRGRPLGVRMRAAATRIGWLALPAAVIVGYATYLWALTGSWTAWYHAQEVGWQRTMTWPWDSVAYTLEVILPGGYADQMGWGTVFRFELVSFVVGLLTVGWMMRRRRWAEAGWVGVQIFAFSLSQWLMSVNRAVLLWFPTWQVMAELGTRRPATRSGRVVQHALAIGWGAISVAAMLWWTWMFGTGAWSS